MNGPGYGPIKLFRKTGFRQELAQRPQFATPDAQSLCHLKAEPVWPETALGSAARVQPLSAGPMLVDRKMTTEAQVWAFAGTTSYSTWKSRSLPP